MSRPPIFRDLVGDDLPPEERARLERVHDLLVAAGPPPELPPSLAEVPDAAAPQTPAGLPRRRAGALLALAAAIATVAFLGGYVAGYARNEFDSTRSVSMHATAAAPDGKALIELGKPDKGGNWPMLVTVSGLPRLSGRAYYELFLTRGGKRLPCGGFNVQSGTTKVRLSVYYNIKPSDGWIVTRQEGGIHGRSQVLLTT